MMKFGIDLSRCRPDLWVDLAKYADELGYESLWIPEHVIFPREIVGSPGDHAHVIVDPSLPLFDPFVVLAALGCKTERIRLGTNVFNIGLRHPFVTARAVATADIMTGGRIDFGIGVGWLRQEWVAMGLDFSTRGARVDESVDICRLLWEQEVIDYHGKFFDFEPVVFNPKPVQSTVPIHVGGDSIHALRRAARLGNGWIGMIQTPSSFAVGVESLKGECDRVGRLFATLDRTVLEDSPDASSRASWAEAGATRLIVSPWKRSSGAIEGIRAFAEELQFQQ
jgi:probable F420-dependent oxidoreductase